IGSALTKPNAMGSRSGAAASTAALVESTHLTAQLPSTTSLVKPSMRDPTIRPVVVSINTLSEKPRPSLRSHSCIHMQKGTKNEPKRVCEQGNKAPTFVRVVRVF
ncbi:hypothetical protein Vafri_11869, partial [Volvox africanus]